MSVVVVSSVEHTIKNKYSLQILMYYQSSEDMLLWIIQKPYDILQLKLSANKKYLLIYNRM